MDGRGRANDEGFTCFGVNVTGVESVVKVAPSPSVPWRHCLATSDADPGTQSAPWPENSVPAPSLKERMP